MYALTTASLCLIISLSGLSQGATSHAKDEAAIRDVVKEYSRRVSAGTPRRSAHSSRATRINSFRPENGERAGTSSSRAR